MIEAYEFGSIIIDGKSYTSDLIISPDGIKTNWWRKQGHNLSLDDLKEVIDSSPQVVIIGTGASGLMKVPKVVEDFFLAKGIEVYIGRTKEAVKLYNSFYKKRRVIACLHLTC